MTSGLVDGAEGVEHRLGPGLIFSALVAGQVAELLAAHGVQRPEDHDLAVLAALQHGLQTGAQRQRGLAGAGPAAERHDPDVGVEQQVERDPLLGRLRPRSPKASRSPRTSRTCLSAVTRPSAAPALGDQHEPGVARQLAAASRSTAPSSYSSSMSAAVTSISTMPVQPVSMASSARYSSAGRPTDDALTRIGRSLETNVTSAPSARRLRATARMRRVVVTEAEAGRQHRGVAVVELDPQRATVVADRDGLVEPAVQHAQLVEQPQRGAGEVAELGMVPLGLQLGDHHDGKHDLVLVRSGSRRSGSASRTLVSRT